MASFAKSPPERFSELLEKVGSEKRIRYDLKAFQEALSDAGNPEATVKTFLIAGTNGKGTSTLYLSAGLKALGYRVATFLSPHLESPRERFLLNMEIVSESALLPAAEQAFPYVEKHGLTYFEYLTLTQFLLAQSLAVDYLVLEVGLGGRLDATNVTTPTGIILTGVALDHQEYLGNTRETILAEKMGVLRPHVPVVSSLAADLRPLLKARCKELAAPLRFTDEIPSRRSEVSWTGQRVFLEETEFLFTNPAGSTVQNASNALALLREIFPHRVKENLETIRKAFSQVRTPGRLEIIDSEPLTLLSGDHNPEGIESLGATLRTLAETPPKILCAFSPDKPYREMLARLHTFAGSPDNVRVTCVERLRPLMPPDYFSLPGYTDSAESALRELRARTGAQELLIITGSLYLIGQLRKLWRKEVRYF